MGERVGGLCFVRILHIAGLLVFSPELLVGKPICFDKVATIAQPLPITEAMSFRMVEPLLVNIGQIVV